MLERFDTSSDMPVLTFSFNGTPMTARQGDSIAAALLLNGVSIFRQTPVSGADRGPFCMMGACFDCLVQMDGRNVQACLEHVRDGAEVFSAHGLANIQGAQQ